MGLKEIAKIANLSPSSVSLVLNGKSGVGSETRKRVLKIAEELDYHVPGRSPFSDSSNGTIQFLKLSKHGEILNKDLNIFVTDYIDGIDKIVKKMRYKFEISSHKFDELDIIIKETNKKKLQGMIILGTELSSDDIESLNQIPIPTVIIDTNYESISVDFINMNNIGALHKIISYFLKTGHKKIGMVSSSVSSGNIALREKGFTDALRMKDQELGPSSIIRVRPSFENSCEDMLQILKTGWDVPEALFCCNDIIAYGCIKALKGKGLKVPDDVSVIGFDDLPLSSMMEPQLTTIKVSQKQIGSLAMRQLVEKIDSSSDHHPVVAQVSGILVKRESVLIRNN